MTHWQLHTPLQAILFDCDSTLVKIEGIDELALNQEIKNEVQALTHQSMGQTGLTLDIYEKRLKLISPTFNQIKALGQRYIHELTEDSVAIIKILQTLNKSIYILSAGFYPAVCDVATHLHIPLDHVMAVHIFFDEVGNYVNFDHASPLISNNGKKELSETIKKTHAELAFIGDGLNDCITQGIVTRFIGFGGVQYRSNVAARSFIYIRSRSLSPVLSLCLTEKEAAQLTTTDKKVYQKGLDLINHNEVEFNHKEKNRVQN